MDSRYEPPLKLVNGANSKLRTKAAPGLLVCASALNLYGVMILVSAIIKSKSIPAPNGILLSVLMLAIFSVSVALYAVTLPAYWRGRRNR